MLKFDGTPPLLDRSRQAVWKLNETIPTDLEMEDIDLVGLNKRISDVDTSLQEASKDTGLPVRELLGLDKALQRFQGELANNVAKLDEVQTHIEMEKGKLREMENDSSYTDEQRDKVKKRLRELKDEHSGRVEAITINKEALQTQFARRMRQTLEKIADSDTTLKERIKTLFGEHGITIVSVLTAVGMCISTIILAVKNAFGLKGGSGGGKKPPSNDPSSVKNRVKKKLQALARLLRKLGSKALSSLPAIIGSIVSWVLNMHKKGVLFMAEHMYAFITFITGITLYWIYEQIIKR